MFGSVSEQKEKEQHALYAQLMIPAHATRAFANHLRKALSHFAESWLGSPSAPSACLLQSGDLRWVGPSQSGVQIYEHKLPSQMSFAACRRFIQLRNLGRNRF